MGRNEKIAVPRKKKRQKGGYYRKRCPNPEWLHGIKREPQKLQSPIKTLADLTVDEIKNIMEKYKHGN